MDHLESLLKNYQYTIQFFSALGTCTAVITALIALWFTRKSTRPKLKVFVDKRILITSEAQETGTVDWRKCEDGISVTIRNLGQIVVYISYFSFYWALPFPFRKTKAMQNPIPDFRKEGSLRLEPGTTTSIMLSTNLDDFQKNVVLALCDKNKVPLIIRPTISRFIGLHVYTGDGSHIHSKIGSNLKDVLRQIKYVK
ncbi:MAG: hypothetical protein WAN11_26575 [Syntrophobacteraceae bacterium]